MKRTNAVVAVVGVGLAVVLTLAIAAPVVAQQAQPAQQVIDMTSSTAAVKEIRVDSQGFVFTPREIRVNQGDRIRLVYHNGGGFHDWSLDEFNAKTRQISANSSDTVEFVANRAGTFEFYCSVGNHRARGMVGQFVVVARR